MKKLLFISIIILVQSSLVFAEASLQDTAQKPSEIFNPAAWDSHASEIVITAKPKNRTQALFGVGMDFLIGLQKSKSKYSKTGDPNTFSAENLESPEEDKFNGTMLLNVYIMGGARFMSAIDVYGRLGMDWGISQRYLEIKSNGKNDRIAFNTINVSFDLNGRYNLFLLGGGFGFYAHAGGGLSFNASKIILWYKYDGSAETSETLTNKETDIELYPYVNAGLGLVFKFTKSESISLGYSLRYYFESMFNRGEYTLVGSDKETTKLTLGDNKLLQGVNLEFVYTF